MSHAATKLSSNLVIGKAQCKTQLRATKLGLLTSKIK